MVDKAKKRCQYPCGRGKGGPASSGKGWAEKAWRPRVRDGSGLAGGRQRANNLLVPVFSATVLPYGPLELRGCRQCGDSEERAYKAWCTGRSTTGYVANFCTTWIRWRLLSRAKGKSQQRPKAERRPSVDGRRHVLQSCLSEVSMIQADLVLVELCKTGAGIGGIYVR